MASSKTFLALILLVTIVGIITAIVIGLVSATLKALSKTHEECCDVPVIMTTNLSEVVVNPGENYTITCWSRTPVIWNYPNISDNQPKIHGTWKNGIYESSLQLTDISYKDVGYYHCLRHDNSEKNSSLYMYVKDTENLLTYTDSIFVPILGIQHQDIIIPCKPTHPEVNVTLCHFGDEKLHIGENDDFGVIRYDQKVGFILENAQMKHNGYYSCCVLPSATCSDECLQTYAIEVLKNFDSIAKPDIDDTHLQHVKVGENVTVECRITVPVSVKFILNWIIPHETDRITVQNTEVESLMSRGQYLITAIKKLKIFNAKLEDTGNYTCKVEDHVRNTNSEVIYLNIFSE